MTIISKSIIQQALEEGTPFIDMDSATFIWEGESAPYLVGDFNHWGDTKYGGKPKRFKRLSPKRIPDSAKTIWHTTLTLPRDAYIEYAFYDPTTQTNFLDPLNKKSLNNGVGGRNNYFYMPETMPSPFAMRRANVTPGQLSKKNIDTWILDEFGTRDIYLYKPPVREAVPLLIVYDGNDYLHRGKLAVIVDNLIADKRIQPIAMAFLQNGKRRRGVEYACSDATLAWVENNVLPLANKHLNLLDIKEHPGAYGVLGASFGGLMSIYTGLRMPDIFGKVLSQAGVFEAEGRDFAAVDLVRHKHSQSMNLWMDVGMHDFLLEDNRRMKGILTKNGYNFTYRECSGSHNYTTWRNDIWRGLEMMFPPQR